MKFLSSFIRELENSPLYMIAGMQIEKQVRVLFLCSLSANIEVVKTGKKT